MTAPPVSADSSAVTPKRGCDSVEPHEQAGASRSGARRSAAELLAASFLYTVLAIVVTWPLSAALQDSVLGYNGFENTPQTLWLYAEWKAYAIGAAHDCLGTEPFRPANMLAFLWTMASFAAKISMANGIDFVFTWPLEAVLGFPAYYNVKCLLIMVTNALSAFVLVRALTRSFVGACVGGAIFGFNTFVLYELMTGRLIESIVFPVPLYALFLRQAWTSSRPVAWALGAGVWAGVATSIYWFSGHFLLAFTLLWIAWCVGRDGLRPSLPRLGAMLYTLGLTLLIVMPHALPYLVLLARGERIPGEVRPEPGHDLSSEMDRLIRQLTTWSCSLGYAIGPPLAMHDGGAAPPWNMPTMMTFGTVLAVAGVAALWCVPRGERFWVFAFGVLYLLPLGPYLKVGGSLVRIGDHLVPLPYWAMVKTMPLLYRLYFPNQAMVLWTLAVAVVIGFALQRIGRWGCGPLMIAALALMGASGVEMQMRGQLPVVRTPMAVPPVYAQAREDGNSGFIYVPVNFKFWRYEGRTDREYYNGTDLTYVDWHMAMHGQKALWGRNKFLAGKDAWMFAVESARSNRFLSFLLDVDETDGSYPPEEAHAVLDQGYRYVVALERLAAHPAAPGGYRTELEAGKMRYDAIRARLTQHLGPPVSEGVETSYDRWIAEDEIVPHGYRYAIFSIRGKEGP